MWDVVLRGAVAIRDDETNASAAVTPPAAAVTPLLLLPFRERVGMGITP